MPLLSRSRFAALARVGLKALLVWQEAGVVVPVRVAEDGTRWYDPGQLARTSAVRLLRDLGVPLAEVTSLLDRPGPAVLAELHALLRRRHAAEADLLSALSPLLGLEAPVTHDVEVVPVPARHVLAHRVATGIDRLADVIGSGLDELDRRAGDQVAGPPSVTFLSPVDDGRDGEVCLEVEVGRGCPGAEPRRAGQALAVRVRGEAARYPQVLAAYDALAARAAQGGLELAGPPAEVYDGDGTLVRWPVA